jgi:hypothetical protein
MRRRRPRLKSGKGEEELLMRVLSILVGGPECLVYDYGVGLTCCILV